MAKLKRSALSHYLNVAGSSAEWFRIGKHIEELSVDMNGSWESGKNILDETSITDEGYEPSISVTPYFADPEDSIYDFLLDLAMNRKSGDDAKAEYLEVVAKNASDSKHAAWKEDCYIEIVSYGGGTEGVTIEYTIHPAGNRIAGSVTMNGKVPTFSATSPASYSLDD